MPIPKKFIDYLDKLHAKHNDDWSKELLEQDFRNSMEGRFNRACASCQFTCNQLLKGLDFKPNDLRKEALESFIAELRTISWLGDLQMQNIKPIPAQQNRSFADFYCEFMGIRYIVETFCSVQSSYRYSDHMRQSANLEKYFIKRAQEKKIQLESTANEFGCQNKIIVLVLNSYPALALTTKNDYGQLLENICKKLNWGNNYWFGLITGMSSLQGNDDSIYPAFP
jgi:hypothetical protein